MPLRRSSRSSPNRVDYVHVALGDSSTYLGSTGIVPPPPTVENAIAQWTEPFRGGPPLVATSRIVDPEEADRLIAEGRADAVGMTRALITDPDLPNKARDGKPGDVIRCIACNACIAHYHAATPIACAQNPRTGRELTLPRPEPAERGLRVVVVGGGPAGVAAAVEAGESGHEVVLLERHGTLGGQVALAGAARGHAELARSWRRNAELLLGQAGVDVRLETEADADTVADLDPEAVVVATGARPFSPALELEGIRVVQAWEVLAGADPPRRARRRRRLGRRRRGARLRRGARRGRELRHGRARGHHGRRVDAPVRAESLSRAGSTGPAYASSITSS